MKAAGRGKGKLNLIYDKFAMIYALWTHIFSWCPGSKPIGIISISISTSIGTSTGNWFAAAYAERRPLMVDLKSEKSQFAFGIIQFFISLKYFWVWRNACISRSLQYSIFCRFVSLPLPCTHTHTHTCWNIYELPTSRALNVLPTFVRTLLALRYKRLLICVFCVLWAFFVFIYL